MSSAERIKIKQQEDKLIYTETYAKLCNAETQVILDNKEKDATYMMNRALAVSEKKTEIIGKAAKKIKDDSLLKQVIESIEASHQGYMTVLSEWVAKSNSNYSSGKI